MKSCLDKEIKEYAFNELTKKKQNHSKVMNIKHKTLEMKTYFKANKIAMIEKTQEIFKIRSRVTDVKGNFKGKYDSIECNFCNEEESQNHIMECKFLNENNENFLEYEEIFEQNVQKQVKIARKFLENMNRRNRVAKQ